MTKTESEILAYINSLSANTLMETLHIEFSAFKNGVLSATMPVESRVFQPFGKLHGGATIALIETVASVISVLHFPNPLEIMVYGTQLNVNHLKSISEGTITADAKIIKAGRTLHLVGIEVKNEQGDLISYATQTNTVRKLENND